MGLPRRRRAAHAPGLKRKGCPGTSSLSATVWVRRPQAGLLNFDGMTIKNLQKNIERHFAAGAAATGDPVGDRQPFWPCVTALKAARCAPPISRPPRPPAGA